MSWISRRGRAPGGGTPGGLGRVPGGDCRGVGASIFEDGVNSQFAGCRQIALPNDARDTAVTKL